MSAHFLRGERQQKETLFTDKRGAEELCNNLKTLYCNTPVR